MTLQINLLDYDYGGKIRNSNERGGREQELERNLELKIKELNNVHIKKIPQSK